MKKVMFVFAMLFAASTVFGQAEEAKAAQPKPRVEFQVDGRPTDLHLVTGSENGGEAQASKVVRIKSVEVSGDTINVMTEDAEASPAATNKSVIRAAVAAATPAFAVMTVLGNYSGTKEFSCPASHPVLITASCELNGLQIDWAKADQLPPGTPSNATYTHWLLPSSSAATGVHCALPTAYFSSQVRLRCATR